MVDFIVHACNGVDAMLETEKWVNLKNEMNRKVLFLKQHFLTDSFAFTLKDIKIKLSSIMSYFEMMVSKGKDGKEICKQWMDSLFVYLD